MAKTKIEHGLHKREHEHMAKQMGLHHRGSGKGAKKGIVAGPGAHFKGGVKK
jgi:hypothetical protein